MDRTVSGKPLYLLPLAALFCVAPSVVYAQSDDTIPPDFRGKIVYDGVVDGSAEVQGRGGAHIGLFGVNVNIPTTQSVPFHSSDHQEIEFSGNTFRGTGLIRGTFNGSGSFSGTRRGEYCDSVDQNGRHSVFRCTLSAVVGDDDYVNPQGQHVKSHTESQRTSLIDYMQRDREQAAARAGQARKDAQQAAYLASRPRATPVLTAALSRAIIKDSSAWSFNRYDNGSLSNAIILKAAPNGTKTIRANYTYNGGSAGWVLAQVNGNVVQCLEYWDAQGSCLAVRDHPTTVDDGGIKSVNGIARQLRVDPMQKHVNKSEG